MWLCTAGMVGAVSHLSQLYHPEAAVLTGQDGSLNKMELSHKVRAHPSMQEGKYIFPPDPASLGMRCRT
jgi:hypothetical protein